MRAGGRSRGVRCAGWAPHCNGGGRRAETAGRDGGQHVRGVRRSAGDGGERGGEDRIRARRPDAHPPFPAASILRHDGEDRSERVSYGSAGLALTGPQRWRDVGGWSYPSPKENSRSGF